MTGTLSTAPSASLILNQSTEQIEFQSPGQPRATHLAVAETSTGEDTAGRWPPLVRRVLSSVRYSQSQRAVPRAGRADSSLNLSHPRRRLPAASLGLASPLEQGSVPYRPKGCVIRDGFMAQSRSYRLSRGPVCKSAQNLDNVKYQVGPGCNNQYAWPIFLLNSIRLWMLNLVYVLILSRSRVMS